MLGRLLKIRLVGFCIVFSSVKHFNIYIYQLFYQRIGKIVIGKVNVREIKNVTAWENAVVENAVWEISDGDWESQCGEIAVQKVVTVEIVVGTLRWEIDLTLKIKVLMKGKLFQRCAHFLYCMQ